MSTPRCPRHGRTFELDRTYDVPRLYCPACRAEECNEY